MTHLILSIFRLVSRLPLRVLYFFSDLMFVLLYRLLGYRREVVGDNLRRSFPELDEAGIQRIETEFYQHFCDLLVESLKMLTMGEAELSRRLKRLGPPACLREQVRTSGRRWERHGVWRTVWLMWRLRWRYWRGSSAEAIAEAYR
jgi:lauroyl/myristoyl acyltransferase